MSNAEWLKRKAAELEAERKAKEAGKRSKKA